MKINDAHDLFVMQIKDLYSAETQLIEALPKMAEASNNKKLKAGFEKHLKQTQDHKQRLEQIAEMLEFNPKNHVCKAMQGLIEEGDEISKAQGDPNAIDAGLIAAAQRVEHYEIAGYGTAAALAKLMDHKKSLDLLLKTLEEEKKTDEELNKIAEKEVNPSAMEEVEMQNMPQERT